MPQYYPICLDLERLPCLVVGGGNVALRKVRTLLGCGANVLVVAPAGKPDLHALAREKRIELRERAYETSDLDGIRLVFVATDDEDLNRRVAGEARARGILANVVDRPALCDFIVPSIVRRGRLLLAISTQGACPAYSKHLRKTLERQFDDIYVEYVELLAELRAEIQSRGVDPDTSGRMLACLLDADLLSVARAQGREAAKSRALALLDQWLAG